MKIKLKDGSTLEMNEGSTAEDVANLLHLSGPDKALAASVNGKVKDLTATLSEGDTVSILNFEDPEGREVFWHTSAHVLAQAILRLWPEAKPTIGPPIENGFYYDFANLSISEDDFEKIEKEIKNIVKENYRSVREEFSKEKALQTFKTNPYKCELINEIANHEELSGYRQGEFFDLCRGPHLPKLGKIKAFKLMRTSGAYWRGDSKNEMLTRIYAISYPDRELLKKHLDLLEEAKKRDHKILGPKLDLFSLKEEAPGMPFIHPKGLFIWNQLIEFLRNLLIQSNYIEIKTPTIMNRELWERSGHWFNYKDNMYTTEIEERDFAIKPMNCPGCMLFFSRKTHSYRELPIKIAEFGQVYRREYSGAISGLFRVRSFHQDDAHLFMKPSDIETEIVQVIELANTIYETFGLEYHLELSTKPLENTIGSEEEWEFATSALKAALDHSGMKYLIKEGEGAFYGPKIDFHIKDAIGRTWQCGTVQLDMALPERFSLEYIDSDGTRKRPVMIHRALFGSIERFFGILIEHFAGKFPFWISPRQIRILTVADRHQPYARELLQTFREQLFQAEVDDSSESVSKKIRNAQLDQVNYILTVGDQEVEHRTANLRTRDNVVHGEVNIHELINTLKEEKNSKSLNSLYQS